MKKHIKTIGGALEVFEVYKSQIYEPAEFRAICINRIKMYCLSRQQRPNQNELEKIVSDFELATTENNTSEMRILICGLVNILAIRLHKLNSTKAKTHPDHYLSMTIEVLDWASTIYSISQSATTENTSISTPNVDHQTNSDQSLQNYPCP